MTATIAALYRHPVKGFTPEALDAVDLSAGKFFPGDRMYAVEVGPSGFDPDAPRHISKMKFAVLARIAGIAKVHTRFDDATGLFHLRAADGPALAIDLNDPDGQATLESWLTAFLGEDATAPLRVLPGRGHRFTDDPSGQVSLLNLASVRDLEARLGRPIDPLRFRANVMVEGWPAWVENDAAGHEITLGTARLNGVKPIVRCAATHVDPTTGQRDIDLVAALYETYGHRWCGLYLSVLTDGRVGVGDPAEFLP